MIEEEVQDEQFEQMLADKQHRQLMGAIKQLVSSIQKDVEIDNKTSQAILQYNKDLSVLLEKIEKALDKPEKESPTPQVNINNTDLTQAIGLLKSEMQLVSDGQDKVIELLSIKPTRLKPVSNYGRIDYVDIEWSDISTQKIKR